MVPLKQAPILNSRKHRKKKNPIPWVILLILAVALWGSMLVPKFSDWQQKQSENKSLELLVKSLQLSTEVKSQELEKKEAEFDLVSGPYLVREKQWFPQEVDTGKIVKILELYALQLENLDSMYSDSKFQLTKVLFGKTQQVNKKSYAATNFSVYFSCDRENLRDFIQFLQTGELSERLAIGKSRGQIELVDYKFLENNLLPLIQLESIQMTSDEKMGTINVRLRANLFSQ